jgi:hypothetical protein
MTDPLPFDDSVYVQITIEPEMTRVLINAREVISK